MVERVRRFMEQWNMVQPGEKVTVGLSGGADSVCLCLVLKELSEIMGFSLAAAHVEHGIRGEESRRDASFSEHLCNDLGIPFTVQHVCVPEYAKSHHMGEEEAARILRYRVFAGLEGKVALAHHMEDNAETMLLALLRGSGLDGLCGMQPVRTDSDGMVYIRPLLSLERREIEAFLQNRGQSFCQDSTNSDTAYTRNFIRREVMPLLQKVNSRAVSHMNQSAERLAELRDYLDATAEEDYRRLVQKDDKKRELQLDAEGLARLPHVLQKRLIHRAIAEAAQAKKDIGAAHIEAVQALLFRQTGRQVDLPYGIVAKRAYDKICLRPQSDVAEEEIKEIVISQECLERLRQSGERERILLDRTGAYLEISVFSYCGKTEEISSKIYTKWFDYDMMKNGFSIRTRKKGDYFQIEGGHKKKLSDYFVNQKIPAERRDETWLLAVDSEIMWIVGGRMGRGGMVTEHTGIILEVTYGYST